MDNTKEIIAFIDHYLERSGEETIRPPEANKLLEKAGLLKDNATRPGKPLRRRILRRGLIPHAYQPSGKYGYWYIPHSSSLNKK